VWVDDQASAQSTFGWRAGKPTLVIVPNASVGLTTEDMRRIDLFVARQNRG
jgi:hypothetical protein